MRAVTVTEYGATPAVAEMPTPEPGPGQVLIKLRAAGMNPMDRTLASGAWKPMPATFPMVLGADGAGVVEQLGRRGVEVFRRRRSVRPVADRPAWLGGNVRRVRGRYRGRAAGTSSRRTRRRCRGGAPDGWWRRARLGGLARAARRQDGADRGCGRRRWLLRHPVRRERRGECDRKRARPAMRSACARTALPRRSITQRSTLPDAVRQAHPDGIDVLIDLVDAEAAGFAALASLVRPGGTAVTTKYVADEEALRAAGITGINFALPDVQRTLRAGGRSRRRRTHRRPANHPYIPGRSARCPGPGAGPTRERQDRDHVMSLDR